MPLPIPDTEKPSGSVPIFSLWMGVHLGLIAGAAVLVEAAAA